MALHGYRRKFGRSHHSRAFLKPVKRRAFLQARQSFRLLDPMAYHIYAELMSGKNKNRKAMMLGVGLDSDGHKRLTTGENFALVGGSQETHEVMTEKTIKINEKLKSRGKQLETVSREEFNDIVHEVGLKKFEPPRKR
jgi:hypothetical protein